MRKIKLLEDKTEIKRNVVETVYDAEDKYFRDSRCVYAVLFDIIKKNNKDCNRGIMIQVNFDKSVISQKIYEFFDGNALNTTCGSNRWVEELFHAFTNKGYYDTRTKEQFWSDYDNVLNGLIETREIGNKL